ncbi:MAG: ATP-binding protein [Candidatus Methylacidiphilales bacterium]
MELVKFFRILLLILALNSAGLSHQLFAQSNSELNDLIEEIEIFESMGDDLKAAKTINVLLQKATEANNGYFKIMALNKKTYHAIDRNKLKEAFDLNEISIATAHQHKLDSNLLKLFIIKSKILLKIDNIDGALIYLLKAKKVLDKYPNLIESSYYYSSFAYFYYTLKDYRKAMEYFKLSSNQYMAMNDYYYYRGSLDNIGLCYRNLNKYDSAEIYFNQAINIAVKHHSKVGEVNALINLSQNYFLKNDTKNAIFIANNAKNEIINHRLSNAYLVDNSLNLIKYYFSQNDLKRSDSLFSEINKLNSNHLLSLNQKLYFYELLFKRYKSYDNEKYIAAYENYILIKDSIEKFKLLKLENGLNDKLEIANKIEDYNSLAQNFKIKELEYKWLFVFGTIFLVGSAMLTYYVVKGKASIRTLKKLQNELNQKNKELSIFNKQKDYILATVAHDLRGPVGNITTITGVMGMNDDLSEENKNLIDLIDQSAELSLNIINDLADAIDIERKTELLKQDKIVLNEVIENAIKMQQNFLQKKKIILITKFNESIEIKGDKSLIIRVLYNLISNAIKFSNTNTQITVETSNYDENNVIVKVIDQGIGIESNKLISIFDAFTTDSRRGTANEKSIGLGLSICKKIVELHHGKIWVESTPNVGSTFYIILPINYLNQILKKIPFEI